MIELLIEAGFVLDERVETQSFCTFAVRLSQGDDTAATELLSRYSQRIMSLAGRRLESRLASKTDAEEVLQSVMRTFYRRLGAGEVELRDWVSLSGLLSLLTLRKCQRQSERFASARRDVRREVSLYGGPSNSSEIAIPDREPTPDEVVAFQDLVETLLDQLSDRDRQMVKLLMLGSSAEDVATELGCSSRTVYRTIAWLRDELISAETDDLGE